MKKQIHLPWPNGLDEFKRLNCNVSHADDPGETCLPFRCREDGGPRSMRQGPGFLGGKFSLVRAVFQVGIGLVLLLSLHLQVSAQIFEEWTSRMPKERIWQFVESNSANVYVLTDSSDLFRIKKFGPDGTLVFKKEIEVPGTLNGIYRGTNEDKIAVNDSDQVVVAIPVTSKYPPYEPFVYFELLNADGSVARRDSFRDGSRYLDALVALFFQPNGDLFIGGMEAGFPRAFHCYVLDPTFQIVAAKSWPEGDPFPFDIKTDRLGGAWVYLYDNYNNFGGIDLFHLDSWLNETYHESISFNPGVGYDPNIRIDKNGSVWRYGRSHNRVYLWKRRIDGYLEVSKWVPHQATSASAWSICTNIEGGLYLAGVNSKNLYLFKLDSEGTILGSTSKTFDADIDFGRASLRSGADSALYVGLAEYDHLGDDYHHLLQFHSDLSLGGSLIYRNLGSIQDFPMFDQGIETDTAIYFALNWDDVNGDSTSLTKVCLLEGCNLSPEPPDTFPPPPAPIRFRIWPNPTTDAVFMTIPASMGPSLVRIWDLHGRLVLEQTLGAKDIEFKIEVKNLRPSCYIYELHLRNEIVRHRLIVTQ